MIVLITKKKTILMIPSAEMIETMKNYGYSPGSSTPTVERMSNEAEHWLAVMRNIRLDVQPLPEHALRELRQATALIERIGAAVFDKGALDA